MQSQTAGELEVFITADQIPSRIQQLLPQNSFQVRTECIKRNFKQFIKKIITHQNLIRDIIGKGTRTDTYQNEYAKNIAAFCLDVLGGDFGDSYMLLINTEEEGEDIRSENVNNDTEIQQEIETEAIILETEYQQKYSNFGYLLEYLHKSNKQISELCINYIMKIIIHVFSNRPWDTYAFFSREINQKQQSTDKIQPSLYALVYKLKFFPGIAQTLGKIISEEGTTNQFARIKKQVIQNVLKEIKSEELLKMDSDKYLGVLQFVSYVFSRNKYRTQDGQQILAKITQRFVDEDVVWFFKQKIVKTISQVNTYLGNTSSSSNSESSKSECEINHTQQQQYKIYENIFENSLAYLKILVQRMNSDEQIETFMGQTSKPAEPTMDFQVINALFQPNSIHELMTLAIPTSYKSQNRMSYYETLVKMTRNSRFNNKFKQTQILRLSFTQILIHLLNSFRKQKSKSGLSKFYIQQLICESILPNIQKLDEKQSMRVVSAFAPSKDLTISDDNRVFCQKILLMLQNKSDCLHEHFNKLGIDLQAIKENYRVKLANNSNIFNGRKNKVKQFEFIWVGYVEPQQKKQVQIRQKFKDDYSSSSEDRDGQIQMQNLMQFEPRVHFQNEEQPQTIQKTKQQQNLTLSFKGFVQAEEQVVRSQGSSQVQQFGIHSDSVNQTNQANQIKQQILQVPQQNNSADKRNRKQSQNIVLQIDSAGEDEAEVVRSDTLQ